MSTGEDRVGAFAVTEMDLYSFLHELMANMAGHLDDGYVEAVLIVDETTEGNDSPLGEHCRHFINGWIEGWMEVKQ